MQYSGKVEGKVTWMIGLLTLTVVRPDHAQTDDKLLCDRAMVDRFGLGHTTMCAKTRSLKACHWRGFGRSDSRSFDWRGYFQLFDWPYRDLGPEMDRWEVWPGSELGPGGRYLAEVEHARGSGNG